jgi:hypothetical protein
MIRPAMLEPADETTQLCKGIWCFYPCHRMQWWFYPYCFNFVILSSRFWIEVAVCPWFVTMFSVGKLNDKKRKKISISEKEKLPSPPHVPIRSLSPNQTSPIQPKLDPDRQAVGVWQRGSCWRPAGFGRFAAWLRRRSGWRRGPRQEALFCP